MLKASITTKLRDAVTRNLPPRKFTVTSAEGTVLVEGYWERVSNPVALDALGFREIDARIHLSSGALAPGDEIDNRYVIWESDTSDTFMAYVARRIPEFQTWTRRRRVKTGTDPVTGEPVYTYTSEPIELHLLTHSYSLDEDLSSGGDQQGRATGVTREGTLVAGDDVQHAAYGTFNVDAVMGYGPWERVLLGSG